MGGREVVIMPPEGGMKRRRNEGREEGRKRRKNEEKKAGRDGQQGTSQRVGQQRKTTKNTDNERKKFFT